MALHKYYRLTKHLSDRELITHRQTITKSDPSLPQRAGKALGQLCAVIAYSEAHPPAPYLPGTPKKPRPKNSVITVKAVANTDTPMNKLAKALLELARESQRKQAIQEELAREAEQRNAKGGQGEAPDDTRGNPDQPHAAWHRLLGLLPPVGRIGTPALIRARRTVPGHTPNCVPISDSDCPSKYIWAAV
ncbi:hypothetical protein ACWEOI_22735 [Nocardia sp. NPDC004340]